VKRKKLYVLVCPHWMRCAASYLLVAALGLGTMYYLLPNRERSVSAFASVRDAGETLIIDAGHGGEDGGAVSLSGVPESGINLSIALRMDQLLGFYGVCPVLLRTEDISLHDPDANTLREKKRSDLQNRVAAIESAQNATLISIHQNTFPNPRYHGAQVFYANGDLSLPLAGLVQELLRQTLDPDNSRTPTRIPDSVYLMNHISCRAILVECGFLSNPEEDQLLQSDGYQIKLASALTAAWVRRSESEQQEIMGDTNENKNNILLHGVRQ